VAAGVVVAAGAAAASVAFVAFLFLCLDKSEARTAFVAWKSVFFDLSEFIEVDKNKHAIIVKVIICCLEFSFIFLYY
jgi:hypothetical protein